jgi:hypothetical protein
LRKNWVQKVSASEGPTSHAQDLAPAVGVGPHGHDHGDRDDAAGLADLHVGGVDPEVRPVTLDRAGEEGRHALVDLLAQPLGGKADHLTQQIGVGALLHQRAQVHHVVGHRGFLGQSLSSATQP